MNGLAFASSLITSALWPIVVIIAIVVFRKPLATLIGRTRRYEGLGQKVEFGPALAEAEDSVSKAVEDAPAVENQADAEPSPLIRQAEENPSYVVLRSWEQLATALGNVAEIMLPGRRIGSWNSARFLPELVRLELVTEDFAKAVRELRDLRNQVAHGQSNPTPGEAAAYAESAQVLAVLLHNTEVMLANSSLEGNS